MKSTGIVRKVDELGRVVLPIELRRTLDINLKDSLEIYVDGEKIILKKYTRRTISMKPTALSILREKHLPQLPKEMQISTKGHSGVLFILIYFSEELPFPR